MVSQGFADYDYSLVLLNYQGVATRANDYIDDDFSGSLDIEALSTETWFTGGIVNNKQLEDEETFTVSLYRNNLTHNIDIGSDCILRVHIEDDDTIDTRVRIAEGSSNSFKDFVNHKARVTEGNDIKLQLGIAGTGNCLVRFPILGWTTASGDVAAIDQSNFTTNGGSQPGLRLPPCTVTDEMVDTDHRHRRRPRHSHRPFRHPAPRRRRPGVP